MKCKPLIIYYREESYIMITLFTNCHVTLFKRGKIFLRIVFPFMILIWHLEAQPIADGKGKYLGNVINYSIPENFGDYWNQVTPENAGKWGSVEATRDVMNWDNLDLIYDYALENDIPFRQHVLIWRQQQPSWIDSSTWVVPLSEEEQREEVEEWIAAFGERYPDTDYIDVVNEPILSPPNDYPPTYKDAIGGDGETGYDWVIWAFEKAREYCPNAELHINVYGVLRGWRDINTYLTIINLLKERDLIDGIAEQGHFLETASIGTISSNLNKLAATGLPIYITEYDVDLADDDEQLAKYQEQFPVFWEHPSIVGITLWGYIEGQMWSQSADAYLIRSNGTERPALVWLRNYVETTTDIHYHGRLLPNDFTLYQNFPNPFNPVTKISYQLQQPGQVRLEIYDILGHKVKTLVNYRQSPGFHQVYWNALDESNHYVSGGVYLYKLQIKTSGNVYTMSKKMLLVK
jgi:endo-1,4-beta-xylanase